VQGGKVKINVGYYNNCPVMDLKKELMTVEKLIRIEKEKRLYRSREMITYIRKTSIGVWKEDL
jgi:hypothetical protein